MPKSKILLGRGSPRSNIPRVEYQNEFLPCDKIIPRFIPEWQAYKLMREYFLEHMEYSHLVLATDDIVVKPEHIKQLIRDIELHDYPVVAGLMNVDQGDKININIAYQLPLKNRRSRKYQWMKRNELPIDNCFKVAFNGFSLMAIRRDIVAKSSFSADRVFEGKPPEQGASLDLVFCYWCQDNNIPVYCDKRIDMEHLRKSGVIMIGQKNHRGKLFHWRFGDSEKLVSIAFLR